MHCHMEHSHSHVKTVALLVMVLLGGWYGWRFYLRPSAEPVVLGSAVPVKEALPQPSEPVIPDPIATHIATPDEVRAIYISSWSAGTASSMKHLNAILDAGKVNAVVIDIKDATGRLSYMPQDQELLASGVGTKRIANLSALIESLHARNIYVIGRISVFQDPYRPTVHPEDALQDLTTGKPWKDKKGLTWLRADNPDVWKYIESIALDAYAQGFDEINMDYVRFPTDGALKNIDQSTFTKPKYAIIEDFFIHLDSVIRQQHNIPLSADVFGLTVSAADDLGIGQKIELIAPYVDYICPMIYPSHFADGSYGFKKPAQYPYEIIHKALSDGLVKLSAANIPAEKMRPWLQDFDLGAVYTADMVQAQIDATAAVGLKSWLMWDASNKYTLSVYK